MDLDVDTDLLQLAADSATTAANGLIRAPCLVVRFSADAIGTSAVGYEASRLLQHRAHQAAAVPIAVHGRAAALGQLLATCAAVFAQLEAGLGS